MPTRGAFLNPENVYATWAHEAAHWTGAKHRMNCDLKSRFDQNSYAMEEYTAEISAAMTCAAGEGRAPPCLLRGELAEVLKADSKAILTAASLASKATDYLRTFSEPAADVAA